MTQLPDLRRSNERAVVGGVCAGVAERWHIDVTLVRIAAILLALSGGIGLVVYAVGALVLPTADAPPLVERYLPGASRWPAWVWLLITLGGCIVVGSIIGSALPFGIFPAIVLAAVYIFGRRNGRWGRPEQSGVDLRLPPIDPNSDYGRAATAWRQRVALARGLSAPAALAPAPRPAGCRPRTATPPRERRWGARLRWTALILAAVSLAVLVIVQAATGAQIPAPVWVAAPTAAVGVCLVAGAFLGRPRGLGFVAVLLIAASLVTALNTSGAMPAAPEVREVVHTAADPAPHRAEVRNGILEVDLSKLRAEHPRTYHYSVRAGTLQLVLPEQGNVEVRYRADFGVVSLPGAEDPEPGTDIVGSQEFVTDPTAPRTVIELSVRSGVIGIER